jgi:hypothetical protein
MLLIIAVLSVLAVAAVFIIVLLLAGRAEDDRPQAPRLTPASTSSTW